jgi:hypothetical protein
MRHTSPLPVDATPSSPPSAARVTLGRPWQAAERAPHAAGAASEWLSCRSPRAHRDGPAGSRQDAVKLAFTLGVTPTLSDSALSPWPPRSSACIGNDRPPGSSTSRSYTSTGFPLRRQEIRAPSPVATPVALNALARPLVAFCRPFVATPVCCPAPSSSLVELASACAIRRRQGGMSWVATRFDIASSARSR